MIRLGTRGSALALTQARSVAAALGEEVAIVTVSTSGDRGELPNDKSRWTSALEHALLAGEIDLAVHSAKDVPGELAPGTWIAAIPERQDPRDGLCGVADLGSLELGARVGTSSLRRAAQLRAARADLEIVELRGNVDTRLRKLAAGEVDAMVLACAGLIRLGRQSELGAVLDLVPAPGQGALLVQARDGDARARRINDPVAERCVMSERALASRLNATCHTPLGASAAAVTGGEVTLTAWIGLPDGSQWIEDALSGPAGAVGGAVAERMLAAGASDLLERAEEMAAA
ncbi:MAG TPA: hydroxymethylbilane synthase [Solirubrobacteraceae bacterium]|nr:hydroxymethylbilane synthase [Solirubrobacteraceae bacterium]